MLDFELRAAGGAGVASSFAGIAAAAGAGEAGSMEALISPSDSDSLSKSIIVERECVCVVIERKRKTLGVYEEMCVVVVVALPIAACLGWVSDFDR